MDVTIFAMGLSVIEGSLTDLKVRVWP